MIEQQAPEEPYPDEDGHCTRCGLLWEEDELSGVTPHLCPPGFLTPIVRKQASDGERCRSFKHGEYNPLECCMPKGHDGEHNYVVKQQAPGLDWDDASRKMIEQAQEDRGTAGSTSALARDIAQCVENAGWWPDDVRIAMNLPPLGDRHPIKMLKAELASSQHGYKLLADQAEKQAAEIASVQRAHAELVEEITKWAAQERAHQAEIAALKQRLEQTERERGKALVKLLGANRMAAVTDDWVRRNLIDARSALADARLEYGEPFYVADVERSLAAPAIRTLLANLRKLVTHSPFTHDKIKDETACEQCALLKQVDAAIDAEPPGGQQHDK